MATIILFAPLIGALICGFGWRVIGEKAAQWTATGFLFLAAFLSWIIFLTFDGETQQVQILRWIESGTLTTDWAILEGEPEKVGATVHFVSSGIDDGGVVFQGRPRLEAADHPNRAYEKVVRLGVEMMSAAIRVIGQGELHACPEPARGRLYRERDFTYRTQRRLWRQWRRIMATYEADREQRDAPIDASLINSFTRWKNQAERDGDRSAGGETNGPF